MGKSNKYINSFLSEVVHEIPQIKLFYEYRFDTNEHLIKINPSNSLNANNEFIKYRDEMFCYFLDNFISESLIFLTEEDLIDINPQNIYIGSQYIDYEGYISVDEPAYWYEEAFCALESCVCFGDNINDYDSKESYSNAA
jgi:hypothetical protein